MKTLLRKIDVTCSVEFTARDIELLDCLTSYGSDTIVQSIFGPKEKGYSVSYNGGVKYDEMVEFVDKLRASAASMKATINSIAKNGVVR